jgi:hypothetical protein
MVRAPAEPRHRPITDFCQGKPLHRPINIFIGAASPIFFSTWRQAALRKRLWLGAGAIALFLATVLAWEMTRTASAPRQPSANFGLDFIAFYTGGTFVREGRSDLLFDLRAVQAFQRRLAWQSGVELGDALGPWWNPPFYAWVFVPLSRLPFTQATRAWIAINVICAALSCWLLCRFLPRGTSLKTRLLVPVLIALSTPFIHCVTHGQNTCTSLLLLCLIATAWRSGKALFAGALAGLLFYKPQLAVVVAGMLVISLGWRALFGMAATGSVLLLLMLTRMPEALDQFFVQMPLNLHFVQAKNVYMWERHATFNAFWRLLLQGRTIGETGAAVKALSTLCMAAVAVMLLRISPLGRWINPFARCADASTSQSRDRLIAATIAATPLLMPFYFDYDLLLLAIPAVLLAGDVMRTGTALSRSDRWLVATWSALFALLLLNADIAEHTRVNLAVPLLSGVALMLMSRAIRPEAETLIEAPEHRAVIAKAA